MFTSLTRRRRALAIVKQSLSRGWAYYQGDLECETEHRVRFLLQCKPGASTGYPVLIYTANGQRSVHRGFGVNRAYSALCAQFVDKPWVDLFRRILADPTRHNWRVGGCLPSTGAYTSATLEEPLKLSLKLNVRTWTAHPDGSTTMTVENDRRVLYRDSSQSFTPILEQILRHHSKVSQHA